ncbi:MAG: single-stranded DNA-binding protein [Eubacteriales bacterium]|nr:single-stranded DNA-binding protein [Eubacteriales bacterium]MDD4421631.1 single-stranded DNA-binding protein [Eubacteriales bacterium]HBR32212.1 single-stranded DNA-binding protein [Clostridiales bacterium]
MAGFNKVILVGNLVADPELKQTANGIAVTSFRIAVGRRFTRQGETPQTDFIDIVCWRQTAEFVTRYFSKGKGILVCGSLQTRSWTDKDNNKRYTTEVVADEVTFVEKKSGDGSPKDYTPREVPNYSSSGESSFEDLAADDELPF